MSSPQRAPGEPIDALATLGVPPARPWTTAAPLDAYPSPAYPDARVGPGLAPGTGPPLPSGHVEEMVRRVTAKDEQAASSYVADLLGRGHSVEVLYLELLAPTAVELGELWKDDRCDFVSLTVALGRLQRIVRELSHDFTADGPVPDGGSRILLSCVPGEQHTLGLFIVAEFFIRDGWHVRIGAPLSSVELAAMVRGVHFDAVGFSVACNNRVAPLRREIAAVRRHSRNHDVAVLVGGRVFNEQPSLVKRVRADASALDARSAPHEARRLLARAAVA